MIYELLLFGGFWFWTWVALVTFIVVLDSGRERFGFSVLTVLAFLGFILLFTDARPTTWILAHPWLSAAGAVGYLVPCGAAVAVMKWAMFVRLAKRERENILDEWLAELPKRRDEYAHRLSPTELMVVDDAIAKAAWTPDLYLLFTAKFEQFVHWRDANGNWWPITKPDLAAHKARIIGWIAFWPAVLLWTAIHDFVERLFRAVYELIEATLQKITDYIWDDDN